MLAAASSWLVGWLVQYVPPAERRLCLGSSLRPCSDDEGDSFPASMPRAPAAADAFTYIPIEHDAIITQQTETLFIIYTPMSVCLSVGHTVSLSRVP